MTPTGVIEWAALVVFMYVVMAFMSAELFNKYADRDGDDYPAPGQYELVRVFVAVLWFLWPVLLFTTWRRRRAVRSSEQSRPPE